MPFRPRLKSAEIVDIEDYIAAVVEASEQRILARMQTDKAELSELLRSGFPNGDPILHREYHRERIEYIKERRKLIQATLEKVLAGGLWALAGFVALSAWAYLKSKIGGGTQ